jgi:hypothetical protein
MYIFATMFLREQKCTFRINLAAIIMVVSLVWLTVSLPFVYNSICNNGFATEMSSSAGTDQPGEELPIQSNEEKAPTNNTQEEYLHGAAENLALLSLFLDHIVSHNSTAYIAYHGELLSPPPVFLS